MDFTGLPSSGRFYSGSERKKGLRGADGSCYMVKFQKSSPFGKCFNHVSEYIGSHIFQLAGIPAQETFLGTYGGEPVVACRDFIEPGTQFVPFNDVGESTLEEDRESYQYDYEDIMQMLRDNSKLTSVEETIEAFWRIYVVDALIGNFDRHGANWGFIKSQGRYSLAPVFDNGSCLFPRLVDDEALGEVLGSEEEMLKRVFGFPSSQIRLDGKKSSYHAVMSSGRFEECNEALAYVREELDMTAVHNLVDSVGCASLQRREFYHRMLELRWEHMVRIPAERLAGGGLR
ncbi:MAG: HipA domain-containing protein [Coriobacteriales bacterium]